VSLENTQSFTNAQRVAAGNVSASNDPSQWRHDGTEQLLKGAELAGAGRLLGMSEEETLAAVSRQYRRQRRADDRVSPQDVVRQMAQSLATTKSDVGSAEIEGVGYKGVSDEAFAFGEDVAYNEQYDSTRADDEQTYRANDRGFTTDEETGLLRRENFEETRGDTSPVAPKSALIDALSDLERAKGRDTGMMSAIGRLFGGGNPVDTEIDTAQAALRQHLESERPSDARVGRAMVRQDSARFNPEAVEANDWRADAEAQSLARSIFTAGGHGGFADENIGRIAEIKSLGKIGETAHVVRTANDAIQGQVTRRHDGVYLNPATGDPVAVQGPELPSVLAGDRVPNNGSSSDNLNAPQTAQEWIVSTLPEAREGTRVFGDYPQVDITLETTNFANRVRDYGQRNNLGGLQGVSANIRSVDELQKVVSYIAGQNPGGLTVPDPQNPGRSLPAGNNVTGGVMNAIGMTLGEQQRFSNAMFQLDAARRSSVNQNPTGTYLSRTGEPTEGVVFDAKEAVSRREGSADVARIPKGATIGVAVPGSDKPVRRSIVTELSRLQDPGAQKPFMGQVQGEKPRINRMRGKGVGEGADAGIAVRKQAESRARGKDIDAGRVRANQVKAMLVGERDKRDQQKRQEQKELIRSFTPANLRQRGRYQ